jgi:predicted acylesterase/phospholipase RssA
MRRSGSKRGSHGSEMDEDEMSPTQDDPNTPRPECDVVMKGGITSGIVYPRLIVELSRRYRFRQVGGASAGAIAATMTAAAQAGQLKETEATRGRSFGRLGDIPADLGTNLPKLFQPSPRTAAIFDVLMALNRPDRPAVMKILAIAGHLIRRGAGWFLLGAAVGMVPVAASVVTLFGCPSSCLRWAATACALLVWLLVALVIGVVVAAIRLTRTALKAVVDNGFGICDGHSARRNESVKPLTDWMDGMLTELAGPLGEDRPVCFGDLWGPEASADYKALVPAGTGEAAALSPRQRRVLRERREIDCLVMATDLSHQRPYRFPFDTAEFFWCKLCLGKYFPSGVVTHMSNVSPAVTRSEEADPTCSLHPGQALYHMPSAPDIPLVIAARISLSFPGLISAVPFQSVDRSRAAKQQGIVTVWFSDGGISSNFPIRFFDAPWPQRPTFGINLVAQHPDYDEMVWRPSPGQAGRFLRYTQITSLSGFLGAIFNSARNWTDSTQLTMPGFRDRVIEIRQRSNEGGMNLQMPAEVINTLADRGADAGRNLLDGDGKTLRPFNFEWHRWVRHRNAMASLDDVLTGMHEVWTAPHASQRDFLDSDPPPPGFPRYPATDQKEGTPGGMRDRANDRQATDELMALAERLAALGHPATKGTVPRPEPEMRLIPPI